MGDRHELEAGYVNLANKEWIPEEEAYNYALDRCLNGEDHEEFKKAFVEWFYSGNYIRLEKGEEL